ncbi:MAG: heme biosynthesis protein HemY [Candidatus Protistobacter heckmanni]|nr:heme biosynthesis protein HemY [Candidatus Protistobacter heckmanni]
MRSLFWVVLLFALAVALALFAQFNQSNVVLFYPPYRIDVSLNLFLLVLLAVFALLYVLIRTASAMWTLPAKAVAYRRGLRMQRAVTALREAISSLSAGRFARAEKLAREAQSWDELSDTAALLAARAAHNMQELARRDEWLEQIHDPDMTQAKLVAKAGMQAESRDAAGALETIEQLQSQGMRQIQVQRIALHAHQQLQNWAEVLRLARMLEKRNALHPVAAGRLKQQACERLLDERKHDADALILFWRSLSAPERTGAANADQAARLLIALNKPVIARTILEQALEENWDERLVLRYASCHGEGLPPLTLITQVENWLHGRSGDPALHFALGRLCQAQQLWGKAQVSLQACLNYARDAGQRRLRLRAHLALAELNDELDRAEQANHHYREAAKLAEN